MKTLPYFRWYPADAETDAAYLSLTEAELGLFHRCLNHSWMNGGIPANSKDLAAALRISERTINRLWPKVSRMFSASTSIPEKLLNPRQEEERTYATTKSERATAAVRTRYVRTTNDIPRAYESVSVSASEDKNIPSRKKSITDFDTGLTGPFFDFWAKYPRKVGQDAAARAWNSVVKEGQEPLVLACEERYLHSREVATGAILAADNWLFKCADDGWKCEWPVNGSKTKQQEASDAWDRA